MSIQLQKPDNKGLTIIEVLIVLAIAGLIMSMVFLAIPALLRNSRNNERKQDVSTMLDAISSFALNNSGRMPKDSDNLLANQSVKLTFYEPTLTYGSVPSVGIGIFAQAAWSNMPAESNTDINTALIYNYRKCDPVNTGFTTTTGAGYRDVVAVYGIETGGATNASKCLQL